MSALAPELILEAVREMSTAHRAELARLLEVASSASPQPVMLLTVAEAAQMLAVSPKTIRRRIQSGDLPASRVGSAVRIRGSDVERLLTEDGTQANPGPGRGRRQRTSTTCPDSTVAAAFRDLTVVR
jgi:excisionase family DNA binding protein